jgi:hypothetical protein
VGVAVEVVLDLGEETRLIPGALGLRLDGRSRSVRTPPHFAVAMASEPYWSASQSANFFSRPRSASSGIVAGSNVRAKNESSCWISSAATAGSPTRRAPVTGSGVSRRAFHHPW